MVMSQWRPFGASVPGPGHVRMGMPNQDSFLIATHLWGDVVVVSDGVGSCANAERGSDAACQAVVCIAEKWLETADNAESLLSGIQDDWMARILPLDPDECSATCLFAVCPANRQTMTLGMLGDGMIAVLKKDGSYVELYEEKDDFFSNQTNALTKGTQIGQWQTTSLVQEECCAVLLCTDGIADDLLPSMRKDFVRHIYLNGKECDDKTVSDELHKMLENWPVPKHSDDKTLVCLCKYPEET